MKKLIAMILMIVLCSAGLSACMGKQNPPVSVNNENVESDESKKDDAETEKNDDSIAEDCLWEALDKVSKKGDLPTFKGKELKFDGEIFTSKEAEESYTQPLSLVGKKVIIVHEGRLEDNTIDSRIPHYFPLLTAANVLPNLCKPVSFADNLKECDYFIFYQGAEYSRDENFYNESIDKVTIATLVIVVDARSHEIVRFYNIGTDSPGIVAKDPTGDVKNAKAELFISGMLRDSEWEDFTEEEFTGLLESIPDPQAYVVFDINDDLLDEVLVLYQDEESDKPCYHIYRYIPDYRNGKSRFSEVKPALQPNVKSFSHAAGKPGIIAEYDGTFLLYSLGGYKDVTEDGDSIKYEMDELETQPIEWIDISGDN